MKPFAISIQTILDFPHRFELNIKSSSEKIYSKTGAM
jgi:hypothetical protein